MSRPLLATLLAAAILVLPFVLRRALAHEARAVGLPMRLATLGVAIAIAAAVPVLGMFLYQSFGKEPPPAAAIDESGRHALTPQQLAPMAEKLAKRLQANPDDNEGWLMLARTNIAMGRYVEAAAAFRTLNARLPKDAQLLADFADTLAMAQGRRLQGEPEEMIGQALAIDPSNLKALALAGSAAFERHDYKTAVSHWERLLERLPADARDRRAIEASLAEARSRIN